MSFFSDFHITDLIIRCGISDAEDQCINLDVLNIPTTSVYSAVKKFRWLREMTLRAVNKICWQ